MRTAHVLPLIVALLLLVVGSPSFGAQSDGVFIHVSHGLAGHVEGHSHAKRVLMGLKMADVMSEEHKVLMYFDVEGVDVLLTSTSDVESPHYGSHKAMLRRLLEKGVSIYVCPTCLQAAGKTESDLIRGVKTAEKEVFFNFAKGRIVSFSY